ncbi:MAG: hypothetical protein KJ072_25255 [Verrucomicrobia bacterium]|nr:hypothetical protein [Verrucomicrobiota bacterium]
MAIRFRDVTEGGRCAVIMNLPSPAQLKDRTAAFLTDCREPEEQRAAEGLADCDPEMKCVRNDRGRVIEVQVVFRCRTRKTFEKYKQREHDLGPWRERDAFHRVRSAVAAVLGREWKLGHFDFVPECTVRRPEVRVKGPGKRKRTAKVSANAAPPVEKAIQAEDEEDMKMKEAERVLAMVQKLDGAGGKPPTVMTFLRLYCIECKSLEQIRILCKCGKGTVLARRDKLQELIGKDPRRLRNIASNIEGMNEQLTDSRAKRIDRERAMDQPEGDRPDHD